MPTTDTVTGNPVAALIQTSSVVFTGNGVVSSPLIWAAPPPWAMAPAWLAAMNTTGGLAAATAEVIHPSTRLSDWRSASLASDAFCRVCVFARSARRTRLGGLGGAPRGISGLTLAMWTCTGSKPVVTAFSVHSGNRSQQRGPGGDLAGGAAGRGVPGEVG